MLSVCLTIRRLKESSMPGQKAEEEEGGLEDAVEEDINRMGIRNYRITALDRQIWAQIAEDALAHTEL